MNEFLWVEKYRPKNIEHCILPDDLKKTFKSFVDAGEVPNLLLCGTAGIGNCLLYTSPSPRDIVGSRMPSSA